MYRWLFRVVLIFFSLSTGVLSKDYDLKQILHLAETHNRDIQLAKAQLQIASAEKLSAYSQAIPKISLNGGYNRNFLENIFYFRINDQIQSFKTSFRNEFSFNAILSQTLFSYKVGVAIQAAKYFSRMTNYQYETTRNMVLTQVKKAFYRALLLQEVYRVAKDSEESAHENYLNIKAKFESGLVSEFDLLQAEVRWQNAIPETIKARKDVELALNQLKIMSGIPLNEEVTLSGQLEIFPPLPAAVQDESITQTHPEIAALIWEKKLREKNVTAQKANFFPSLNANLQYTYRAASDRFRLEQDNDNIILGISLQVPVFSGGNNIAQVRKARAEVDIVKAQLNKTRDNIRIQLRNVLLRLQEARQRIDAARHGVETAQRAYEIALTRVNNQLATQVELKENRVALDRAQLNYYSAIFDYLDSYFDWQYVTGHVSTDESF
ncbi:MAG: TolC family protein [Calditrichaeota bacterium]|nr:MAG: TolC family protein [Calditrichota bacterium]